MAFPTEIVDVDELAEVEFFSSTFVNSTNKVFIDGMQDIDESSEVDLFTTTFVNSANKVFSPGMFEVDQEMELFGSIFLIPPTNLSKVFYPMAEFEIINIPATSGDMFEIAIKEPEIIKNVYTPRKYEGDILLTLDGAIMDVSISGKDLDRDAGLQTAILLSLLSDRRAALTDILPSAGDMRGWWADNTLGSKFWLYERAKIDADLLGSLSQEAVDSLKWLVDDGIAMRVNVLVSKYDNTTVSLRVRLSLPRRNMREYKFYYNVENQLLR